MTMDKGIYLLANDVVYDQLVALINSIEVNYSPDIPICIIPFNDKLDLIRQEITKRKNVFLFDDQESIARWENFIAQFDRLYFDYPHQDVANKYTEVLTMHRKYCAFDGPFDKFIYLDLDTLVFQPLDHVFNKLDEYDFVVHDYQRKTSLRLKEVDYYFEVFKDVYPTTEALANRFHCGGFWASKRKAINEKDLEYFLEELSNGDIKIFRSWLSEQTKLNYMTVKKNLKLYNFTLDESSEYNTGVCITSSHFEEKNHVLYDKGKKLTYLHYMGIKNDRLRRLCEWEKRKLPFKDKLVYLADKFYKWQISNIPYREIFLYYRFIGE
jgi:hypothetical protein